MDLQERRPYLGSTRTHSPYLVRQSFLLDGVSLRVNPQVRMSAHAFARGQRRWPSAPGAGLSLVYTKTPFAQDVQTSYQLHRRLTIRNL